MYYIYYDENNNGNIIAVSPVTLPEMDNELFIQVKEEIASPFIQGTEKTSRWKVDCVNKPKLIKKDNYIFHQYDSHGFFNVENQSTNSHNITITINRKVIVIATENHDHALPFFLTKKDNPTYLLQKMTLEPNVVRKQFVSDIEQFSIFADHSFGKIKCHRI